MRTTTGSPARRCASHDLWSRRRNHARNRRALFLAPADFADPLGTLLIAPVDKRWLDYASGVLNAPAGHRKACIANGGAIPGPGCVDGNELRWPGYLGRNYHEGTGVLCVGAVDREATLRTPRADDVQQRTDRQLVASAREWRDAGRSPATDAKYLEDLRRAHEDALPMWSRWKRHFRPLIEDCLGMDRTQIAWTNLAKCRVSLDRGPKQRAAEGKLTRLCQRAFPMNELVEAIRPVAVLVAVLRAGPDGDIVTRWSSPSCSPLVFSWQGQSGHDRHNTDPEARPLREWAPEMAREISSRIAAQA
jgi:hypothetical protein